MSSGWHRTLTISHPDEILPIAVIRMAYCTGNESITYHAYDIGTRSYPRSSHYGPFVRESTRNAALWDWYCFVVRLNKLLINQSNRRWVQKLQHSCDVTAMSERDIERYVRRLEINAGGNIVNFMKYSSFSTPISFGQLPVKSVPKRCSICRYSRFTDIEWASKKRFQQSSEAMGIPIQAWMTNNMPLFNATWLLIHAQISMMVSPISFSNSGHRANMAVHHRVS